MGWRAAAYTNVLVAVEIFDGKPIRQPMLDARLHRSLQVLDRSSSALHLLFPGDDGALPRRTRLPPPLSQEIFCALFADRQHGVLQLLYERTEVVDGVEQGRWSLRGGSERIRQTGVLSGVSAGA